MLFCTFFLNHSHMFNRNNTCFVFFVLANFATFRNILPSTIITFSHLGYF